MVNQELIISITVTLPSVKFYMMYSHKNYKETIFRKYV